MRRGSALLIVLGMMAFMVVSAVAFSMFMRQSRLPSSFLRQRVTSAQLVKAGLANAMREIDEAIGNDPYPGVRNGNNSAAVAGGSGNTDRNYWKNRVFMGESVSNDTADEDDLGFETVSTLPLEGLAYVPPPLINTVRYWSRRTRTAAWSALGYDAGRYAYTAVNVSDYFDLNHIRSNVMRDSSPQNRISMGYLFENDAHTGDGTVSPEKFDQFVAQTTNDEFRTRLVSMADYNLAVDSGKYGDVGFQSPFCSYIRSPKKDGSFYGALADDAKRQKFVTDSWHPGSLTNVTAILLTDDANGQPLDGKRQSLDDLQNMEGNAAFKILRERLDLCTLGALYDYIDEDSVPISLAIPTLEHVPMLTGIQIVPENFNLILDGSKKTDITTDAQREKGESWTRQTWFVKSLGEQEPKVTFNACLAYPFKRTSNVSRPSSYEVQVLVRMFLTSAGTDFSSTRLASPGLKPGKDDWKAGNQLAAPDKAYLTLFASKNVSVSEGTDEEHCAIDLTGIELKVDPNAFENAVVYGLRYNDADKEKTAVYDETDFGSVGSGKKLGFRDVATGRRADVADGQSYKLCYAVWVRVMDGADTVDLVPATMADDDVYNGHLSETGDTATDNRKVCGAPDPLLPLAGGTVLALTKDSFVKNDAGGQVTEPQGELSIYCDDPRFNYAPEDWYRSQNGVKASDWLATARTRCAAGTHGQDSVFQFVSDEGYLQSLGELQFLPYLRSFKTVSDPYSGAFYNAGKYDGNFAAAAADCANQQYAWQTHFSFGDRADTREGIDADPYSWGILDSNGGMKVSPYADEDLMMAAIANTPYDWIVASVNDKMNLKEGRKFCFGPSSPEAKVDWEELQKVVRGIKAEIGANPDWESRFSRAATWDDEGGTLFGADMGDDFHDIDRKFLYSYWKGCFGNEQQLFLIFVRAEPAVMGGSSAGHTPSQLGARAVALVWREPVSTVRSSQGSVGVHRMRILFYHQFD